MRRPGNRNLVSRCTPVAEWPAADRIAWGAALAPGDLLEPGGPAAHWSRRSRDKTAKGYSRWISWLAKQDMRDSGSRPADRVTPERVAAYIRALSAVNSAFTVLCRVQELYDAIRCMSPHRQWDWLCRLQAALRARALPVRDKRGRLRSARDLAQLGESMMAEAEATSHWSCLRRAMHYRDGLMIALLAHRPLRLKNFAAIAVDTHLIRHGATWWLRFTAAETKNARPIDAPVPAALLAALERYLAHHRQLLLAPAGKLAIPVASLWVSGNGTALQEISIHYRIRKHTQRAFGQPLPPHWFRDCAATSIAIEDPRHARSIMSILGHSTLATAERHYNQARSLEASRRHHRSLAELRGRLAQKTLEEGGRHAQRDLRPLQLGPPA